MSEPQVKAEYTRGSIGYTMLKTATAMLAATLAMSGFNIADTYFVGRLDGHESLAAMGFTFPVVMVVGCLFHGLGTGCMANLAHAQGRGDARSSREIVFSGLALLCVVAFVMSALGIAFATPLYHIMGAKGHVLEELRGYMNIWFFGCVTSALTMESNKMLVAAGRPRLSSAMTIMALALNVILDPIMIFGLGPFPRLGVRGAALATVISQAISAVVNLYVLHRVSLLEFKLLPLSKLLQVWAAIIKYAIPAILGMMVIPLGNFATTRITAEFGDVAVAAVAAAARLEMVAFVFPMSVGIGLMPMIAQNYGARLYSRVKRCYFFAITVAFVFLLAAGAIMIVFAPQLVAIFSKDAEVQKIMVICMHIIPYCFWSTEIMRFNGFTMTGCGRPNPDAWLKVLRLALLLVPLSYLAMRLNWLSGLFYARVVTDIVACGAGALMVHHLFRVLPADGKPDQI